MTKFRFKEQEFRVDNNGRLCRVREKNQKSDDPEYIQAITKQHNELFKKLFDNRDNGKLILKQLSTKLKNEGVRHNYQKIKAVIGIYWEGNRTEIYCTKSGYFRIEKYDQGYNVVKYYFIAEDVQDIAEKLWKFRLMNRKFYNLLVKI